MTPSAQGVRDACDVLVRVVRHRPGVRCHEADAERHGSWIVGVVPLFSSLGRMPAVTITVRPNGPYKIVGPITVVDGDGREFELPEGSAVVLCRCGHSSTKPFCDATHKRIGFVADDMSPRLP